MLLASIASWSKCEEMLERFKPDAIWFIVDFYNRTVTVRFTDGLVIYEYSSESDEYPSCDIYEFKPEGFPEDGVVEIESDVLGERVKYLVGCQKLDRVELWCVYSNYYDVVRPVVENKLSKYGLPIEGIITEVAEAL
ncbi:MAG: hypothetical protein DRJ18_02350 [Candidatus Methanomethylicota archaeon]|nr:hypothetical protein [Candidatus Culexmicrobium cathedralense]RLE48239.1 MAG: hypothetical protein DRJ18_02350 [Candidatus Verstraetearchaeota archaeon]